MGSKKHLVIAPPWVGDMVMTHSLIRLLKIDDPQCSIDVFALPALHPLIRRMPEIDNIITSTLVRGDIKLWTRFKIGKALRKNGYNQAYLIPNSFKSALVPFFAKIPTITGFKGEQRQLLINDSRILNKIKLATMIKRFVYLGCPKNSSLPNSIPLPQLSVSQDNLNNTLGRLAIDKPIKPILALCPGAATFDSKRWPPEYFAEVAKTKHQTGWNIWILGGREEQESAKIIQKNSGGICLDLTGKTGLDEVIDLLSLVTVVVTNDSGLMHIASAVHLSVVAIYGPTSPALAPPLSNNKTKKLSLDLPCSPCEQAECPLQHNGCLYKLKPELVLAAIDEVT